MADRSDNTLDIYGSHQRPTYAVTSATTAVAGRHYTVNTTGGSVTMTLPTLATTDDGAEFVFWKSVAANSMVVDGAGAETIEGSASVTVSGQYTMVRIRKAGSVWQIMKATTNPDGIAGAQLADDSVDSEHIAAGAVDLEHMSANSVDSDQYVDGSIDGVHIANDAIDSQHYAAGSIDNEHLAADSVDSTQYVDGSIDPEHFAAAAVVGATLGGGGRANTVDTACTLNAADALTEVTISSTNGAGTFTITRGTLPRGVPVFVRMTAFDTNAYTAAVVGGTVTFNAVDELAMFYWDGTGLRHVALVGATFA